MSPDLVAACIAELQADAPTVAAFGEDPSTPKFFGDTAVGQPLMPYLVFHEPDERREYTSSGNYIAHGQLTAFVYAGSKLDARNLGDMVAGVLNDSVLTFTGQKLMKLRVSTQQFVPATGVGPDAAVIYQRQLTFDYMTSGQI